MIYGDGSSQGYYARELAQYGLGDAQLGGLFSFVGKAVKGVANVASTAAGVGPIFSPSSGGGEDKTSNQYRVDGARWSNKKGYWELPPGKRAAVQSPAPSGVGNQAMTGGPAYPLPSSAPVMAPTPVQVNTLPAINQGAFLPTGPNAGAVTPFFPIPATPSSAGAAPPVYAYPPSYTPVPAPAAAPLPSWVVPAAIGGAALLGFLALSGSRGGSTWGDHDRR